MITDKLLDLTIVVHYVTADDPERKVKRPGPNGMVLVPVRVDLGKFFSATDAEEHVETRHLRHRFTNVAIEPRPERLGDQHASHIEHLAKLHVGHR